MASNTATAPELRPASQLTRLDRCHDKDSPHGILVVLEVLDQPAGEYELTPGISVADIHDGYPRDDPVVVCIYDRLLDHHREAVDLDSPHLVEDLQAREAELHYYPARKLECYDAGNYTETADGCRCEHCGSPVGSTVGWVEHVVRQCPSVQ